MKIRQVFLLAGLLFPMMCRHVAVGQVVLQSRDVRLEIGDDGVLRSLRARRSDCEYAWAGQPGPIATVFRGGRSSPTSHVDFREDRASTYRGGRSFPASGVKLAGEELTVEFTEANVTATYQVTTTQDYLALRLRTLEGEPVDRIDLLRLRVKKLPYLGRWINVAYDDAFGICLCAGNIRTNAGMNEHEEYVEMRAIAEKGVGLEGATAVLFGCPEPSKRFLDAMEVVERDCNLPAGARHRRSPIQRYSYLWCSPTTEDVSEYIRLAERGGFRMILFSYRAFARGAGHFLWNSRYPNGMADLKKVADAIRGAGLKLGLHIHYSKAQKNDPYVTPVPDDRLHAVRRFALATAIDARADTIPVVGNPQGCTVDDGRRILKAGKELIAYDGYSAEPPFRFTGCKRGHLGTTPAAHQAADRVELLDVDSWDIFIRFDQDTDIQDEVGRRIGEIVNRTGPYDMVYFDGAEDVHAPFWHHVAGAQHRVYRHFRQKPPVGEAALNSHFSWHMMTRSNAYDVPSEHIKNFTYHVSCRTAPVRALDFSRIEFGWIFGLYDFIGPDVLEYVLSRAAAWDCPFSIRISPAQLAAHPRGEDCMDVIKLWEDARAGNKLSDAQRQRLRTLAPGHHRFVKVWDAVMAPRWKQRWANTRFTDQEHHLFINEQGEHELVAVDEIPGVAGGFFKAYSFRRASRPKDAYVLIWAVKGQGRLLLPAADDRVHLMRPFGRELPVQTRAGRPIVPIGNRRYLVLRGMNRDQAREVLRKAHRGS